MGQEVKSKTTFQKTKPNSMDQGIREATKCLAGSKVRVGMDESTASKQAATQNLVFQGFPGGPVVKNLPADARDAGPIPGQGRSHLPQSNWARVPQLLRLHSRAREPQLRKPACLEPLLRNEKPLQGDAHTCNLESSPRALQLEKDHVQQ